MSDRITLAELCARLGVKYDDGTPGAKVMIIPHIIPVECDLITSGIICYQMEIPLGEVPDGFLLTGIHSRYEIEHIRIRKGTKEHFSAPGWFVYAYHDHKLEPALYIDAKSSGWFLDASYRQRYEQNSFNPKTLQFALIGQKVVPL